MTLFLSISTAGGYPLGACSLIANRRVAIFYVLFFEGIDVRYLDRWSQSATLGHNDKDEWRWIVHINAPCNKG